MVGDQATCTCYAGRAGDDCSIAVAQPVPAGPSASAAEMKPTVPVVTPTGGEAGGATVAPAAPAAPGGVPSAAAAAGRSKLLVAAEGAAAKPEKQAGKLAAKPVLKTAEKGSREALRFKTLTVDDPHIPAARVARASVEAKVERGAHKRAAPAAREKPAKPKPHDCVGECNEGCEKLAASTGSRGTGGSAGCVWNCLNKCNAGAGADDFNLGDSVVAHALEADPMPAILMQQ